VRRGQALKRGYVAGIRGLRLIAGKSGLLSFLQRRGAESDTALWLRSLFAIYDLQDMAALDLPWWTLAAVRATDEFLKRRGSARVFEYGSGASTVWLARRAASVVSIEHDRAWYGSVNGMLAAHANARIALIEADPAPVAGYCSEKKGWKGRSFQNYASAIDRETGQFDLIVIDGRARTACLAHSVKRLAPDGMILFDNSGRERYRAAIKASDLTVQTFRGVTACLPYPDETTILRFGGEAH
jgi:predicted O-methyltransferase YrrM